jgi:hypothetical protein
VSSTEPIQPQPLVAAFGLTRVPSSVSAAQPFALDALVASWMLTPLPASVLDAIALDNPLAQPPLRTPGNLTRDAATVGSAQPLGCCALATARVRTAQAASMTNAVASSLCKLLTSLGFALVADSNPSLLGVLRAIALDQLELEAPLDLAPALACDRDTVLDSMLLAKPAIMTKRVAPVTLAP